MMRCVDVVGSVMPRRSREVAERFAYIQPNASNLTRWLVFDVDEGDAFTAAERAGVAEPDIIVLNPDNHRGHLYYLLSGPVAMTDKARRAPIAFLNTIKSRMTEALRADRCYVGLIAKNPLHSRWRVRWGSCRGYSLQQLFESLPEREVSSAGTVRTNGTGRNCDLFETVRRRAYRAFAKRRDYDDFVATVENDCRELNATLDDPLPDREVFGIAKSISGWVGQRFSDRRFREMQSFRSSIRWNRVRAASGLSGKVYPEKGLSHSVPRGWQERLKPWKNQGISRATYYRRKRKLLSNASRPRTIRRQRIEVRPKINRTPPISVTLESIYALYCVVSVARIQPNTA